jgi:uncharacterized membrane protein YesL
MRSRKSNGLKQNWSAYNEKNIFCYIDKIFDMIAVSLLWLITSLPVITIGASTSALYYTVNKVVLQDRGYLAQEFFHSFRQNLKDGTILWLILGSVNFLLQLNIGILYKKTSGLMGIFFIIFYLLLFVLETAVILYCFPVLSRFAMNAGWNLKLAIYMVFRYFPATIVILILFAVALLLLYISPLFLLFVPSCFILVLQQLVEPLLQKHMPKQ